MPPHFTHLFSNFQPVWGGIDRNVPHKAAADPAGLQAFARRGLVPLVQYKGLVHALLVLAGTVARCAPS